jgi:hypothetical protein
MKFLYVHLHQVCPFVNFSQKPTFVVVYVKKDTIYLMKSLILALNFVFLHMSHAKLLFMKRFCGHIACGYAHVGIFLFNYLTFRNICLRCILK